MLKNHYDAVFLMTPCDDGIEKGNVRNMLDMIKSENGTVLLLDMDQYFTENGCCGIISIEAAEKLDYEYKDLGKYLYEISKTGMTAVSGTFSAGKDVKPILLYFGTDIE